MNVACVLITHFPVKAEIVRDAELADTPFLVLRIRGSSRVVVDWAPGVEGVKLGMPLQEALAQFGGAQLIEEDTGYYSALWEGILDKLEQRSPIVEDSGLGRAFVGLDGLEALYGGMEGVVAAVQNGVSEQWRPRVGVGKGKFLAYVAALRSEPGRAVTAPESTKAFLASMSIDVLPVDYAVKMRLRSFGIRTMGEAAALGVGPLQGQFGKTGKLMWELANGIDRAPLIPRKVVQTATEAITFQAPTASTGIIMAAVELLLTRAFLKPELRGRYVREATLAGDVARGGVWTQRVAFREPVGEKARILFVVKSHLEARPLAGPLEGLKLTLTGLTGEVGRQESLLDAVRQLEVSLGKKPPIFTVREIEPWSRIPERRFALVQFGA